MKKTVFSFVLIIHPLFANSMQPAALAPEYQPVSLRDQCLDKIVYYLQHDPRYNAALLAHVPLDAVPPLLEKLNRQLCTSKKIATLPAQGKISPDGTKVLILTPDDQPLKVHESATGIHLLDLEDSLTSAGKVSTLDNRRFIPIKWSSTGKYIYANFRVSQNYWQHPIQYLYKIWDSTTGKRLYNIPFEPCGKLYFSPNDQFLLGKLSGKPLRVYHGATGTHAATLGPKTRSYWRYPQDPQNQWIMADDEESDTELYDTQAFALAKKLPGQLKCFSADGDLIAIKTEEDTGRVQESHDDFGFPSMFNRTQSIMAPFALIYNRRFETLSKIPLKGHFDSMAISPCYQFLIHYDSKGEARYSIATKEESQKLEHYLSNFDIESNATFSSFTGDATIKLEKKPKAIDITIERNGTQIKLTCPTPVNKIVYTENTSIIGLLDFQTLHYFLNIKTGALIPCNVKLKGIFNFKAKRALAQGRFITENDEHFELHKLAPVALAPCIQLLTERLEHIKKTQGKLI